MKIGYLIIVFLTFKVLNNSDDEPTIAKKQFAEKNKIIFYSVVQKMVLKTTMFNNT